jgi:predicted Zn-dependent peptidase
MPDFTTVNGIKTISAPPFAQVTRLSNGLTVVSAEMPHMTSVSLGIWVGVGSRYESAQLNGASHFIEHMLFKGTKRRSALKISQDIEGIGGYLNAFTSEEFTCFHAKARHDRLPNMMDVLADMFLHSRLTLQDLRKEREVIKEEVAHDRDEPQHHVFEQLNAAQWPGQPLGQSVTGTPQSLNRLKQPQLLAHLATHYVNSNTVVCAAGNCRHEQVVALARQHFRGIKSGARSQFIPARHHARGPVIRWNKRRTEQTHLALAVRTIPRQDPRWHTFRLLNVILGENSSSRLFRVIREDRGLAYSIQSSLGWFHDTGDWVVSAGLDTRRVPQVLRLFAKEIEKLARQTVPRAELQRARDYVIGQIDLGLENTESVMMNLGEEILGFGRVIPPQEIREALFRVTPAQIQTVVREFFQPRNYTLAIIGPKPKADSLASCLV